MSQDHEAFRTIALFKDLPSEKLASVAGMCTIKSHSAGQEVVCYLDLGTDVFFMLAGRAKANIYSTQGKIVGFRDIGPGEFFGEFAAIDSAPRSATVEALVDCQVAVMQTADFKQLATHEPTVAEALMCHFVRQLRSLTSRVYEFSTLAVNSRIQIELLRLANEEGCRKAGDSNVVVIESLPTHAEFAAKVSTHREAVSRHFSYLTRQGLIEKTQSSALQINDLARLAQMVCDATGE